MIRRVRARVSSSVPGSSTGALNPNIWVLQGEDIPMWTAGKQGSFKDKGVRMLVEDPASVLNE